VNEKLVKEVIMLTINEIIREKRKAFDNINKSSVKLKFYDEILNLVLYNDVESTVCFNDFSNKKVFHSTLEAITDMSENDYELKNLITDIDANEEEYEINVSIKIEV
jgi:regulatory protein YycI of two-component signal transduction system YycFG